MKKCSIILFLLSNFLCLSFANAQSLTEEANRNLMIEPTQSLETSSFSSPLQDSSLSPLQKESETTPNPPLIQYILTQQGVILSGTVIDKENSIYLQLPEGKGGFTISKPDIQFIGQTRQEVFDYRRLNIHPRDWKEFLKLADWAGRNELESPAQIMLKELLPNVNDQSVIEIFQQKIIQLQAIEQIKRKAIQREKELKIVNSNNPNAELTEKQLLDLWSKSIPQNVHERYLRRIQPILYRRCLKCHSDSNVPEYQLQNQPGGLVSREINLKNMRETFAWINFSEPAKSPILFHSPVSELEEQNLSVFGRDRNSLKDYENFVEWVNDVPKRMPRYTPDPLRQKKTDSLSNSDHYYNQNNPNLTNNPENQNSALFSSDLTQNTDSPQTHSSNQNETKIIQLGQTNEMFGVHYEDINSPELVLKRGNFIPEAAPKDDYDPLLFNQRYHPEKMNSQQ